MEAIILDTIPFRADIRQLRRDLRIKEESRRDGELLRMAAEAESTARPAAALLDCAVTAAGSGGVTVGGTAFDGGLLAVNLTGVDRVFPFIATCGMELERWSQGSDDILYRFWAEAIKMQALQRALAALSEQLDGYSLAGERSMMNPGSLEGWPLEGQRRIFGIFGAAAGAIGVSLTESCVMIPTKSLSGLIYHSERQFINCRICPREVCQGRRAPYDRQLHESYAMQGGAKSSCGLE